MFHSANVLEYFSPFRSEYSDADGIPDPDLDEAVESPHFANHDINELAMETHSEEELNKLLEEFKIPIRPKCPRHSDIFPDLTKEE